MIMASGDIYIVSAPSGAGKTSLVTALIQEVSRLKISISHTTRAMRPGEKQGMDYHFVKEAEFQEMMANQVFLESAEVFGKWYGTSRVGLQEQLAAGFDVILEIDWQGARQVRKIFPKAISIFILPPSQEELRFRLERRHQDHPEVIEKRLKEARQEISKFNEFDYLICNDKFEEALEDLKAIVRATRLRLATQEIKQNERITLLLS